MEKQEAIEAVVEKVMELSSQAPNEAELRFGAEKLVLDILDYCHRDDFPQTLIYTMVPLILKEMQDKANAEENGTNAPISSIEMGDTTIDFAVNAVSTHGLLSDADFDSIKPKLNLYRKLVSHA